jgi:hypothetical protein
MWPCDRQAPRRVALSLFQVADSRQSLSAQNPPPSPSLHGKQNKLQACLTQSSISLFLLQYSSSVSSRYLHSPCISSTSFLISLYTSYVIIFRVGSILFLCYSFFPCSRLSFLHIVDQGTKDITRKIPTNVTKAIVLSSTIPYIMSVDLLLSHFFLIWPPLGYYSLT